METKYRTPDIKEFVPGFKCETNYCLFVGKHCSDEWVEVEFTEEMLDMYLGAIECDAYPTEFRVKI